MLFAVGSDSVRNITNSINSYLKEKGFDLLKFGALAGEDADYVDAAKQVAEAVAQGKCEKGLIFCNTGTGVTIIANKIPGVRAALCVDPFAAKISRLANNANVIVISMRNTGEGLAKDIIDTWLSTEPSEEPRRKAFHTKTDQVDAEYRKV